MDFDRSIGGRPFGIVTDQTFGGGRTFKVVGRPNSFKRPRMDQPPEIPVAVVNGFGGSPPPTGSYRHGGPPESSERPRPIPISSSKAVRVGSPPIDSEADPEALILLKTVFPDLMQTSKSDSNFMKTLRDAVFRHQSEFPEFNLLQKLKDSLPPLHEYPGIKLSTSVFYGGPVPSPKVYKCNPIAPWDLREHVLKENLKRYETSFKRNYSYSTMEYRHCITANDAFCWKQKSSGIMWAGVYGINDICVVTLTGQLLDRKRVHGCLASLSPKFVLTLFRECVLSELEDLAEPMISGKFDRSFDPPFCVVSETLMPDESGHETSSGGYAHDAVSFVRGSGLLEEAKDSGGAIKLAICAFERLMGKKFEAKEIEVTVMSDRKFGKEHKRDLDMSEIGDYFADDADDVI